MPGLRRLCPAKVNLYLKVLGRRADGYHELVTVMQPLSLADEVVITPAPVLSLRCSHPGVPEGPENLVWRAATRLAEAVGRPAALHIHLHKRIPVAAGLGGGSSDAAGTLLALNDLWGRPLEEAGLHQLAAALGADVPFFLSGGPAVGRGIGTELSPLDLPPYWYVLLNPGLSLSTRWVYDQLDLPYLQRAGTPLRQAWEGEHPESWVGNDLESVTLSRYPELRELLRRVAASGARAWGMSGSGPTLFGLFFSQEQAEAAAARLRPHHRGWLAVARGLTRGESERHWENQAWMI